MKRLRDILIAGVALLLLAPIICGLIIANWVIARRAALVWRDAIGRGGRPLRLANFRTRLPPGDGEIGPGPLTGLGRFLISGSLHRIPELVAVLRGDLALIGPPPLHPHIVARLPEDQRAILEVRPGLIDQASVVLRGLTRRPTQPEGDGQDAALEQVTERIELNQRYQEQAAPLSDMRLLVAGLHTSLVGIFSWLGRPGHVMLDCVVLSLAFVAAFMLRFDFDLPELRRKQMIVMLPYTVLARVAMNSLFGVYRIIWSYVSLADVWRFLGSVATVSLVFLAFRLFYPGTNPYFQVSLAIIAMEGTFSLLGMVGLRFSRRWLYELSRGSGARVPETAEKAVIVGAGEMGRQVAREIRGHVHLELNVVGLLDDDPGKLGTQVEGVRVIGSVDQLEEVYSKVPFSILLLAVAELPRDRKRALLKVCERLGVAVRTLPSSGRLIVGDIQVSDFRDVRIEDLLGRPVAELTRGDPRLQPVYGDRRILVTGAGGSIGAEVCRQLARIGPSALILVEKDENNLFYIHGELRRRFEDIEVIPYVVDVRDRAKLSRAMAASRPDVVLHAAAYKHVPLMEANPGEAIENNVIGTTNVAELSQELGVAVMVMISTDKAVNPTSVMGASKRIAELVVRQLADRSEATRYASVRFGNVLGSRGSVIPTFREQILAGGPVTVTHPEMRRFFMTIPEASQLVLKAGTLADRGEVFVLDMGEPVKIIDLARDMIRLSGLRLDDIPIEIVGLRPGEKLYEELLVDKDNTLPTPIDKIFMARPELRDFEAFRVQLDALFEVAREGAPAEVRATLATMDIGLRLPDTDRIREEARAAAAGAHGGEAEGAGDWSDDAVGEASA